MNQRAHVFLPMDVFTHVHLEVPGGFSLSRVLRTDKGAYVEHMADPEIARNTLAIPFPYNDAHAEWWVEHCEQQACDPEVRFAIREPAGSLVGAIGLVGTLPMGAHCAEFGYWLAKAYRSRGLMPQVIEVFADHAFARLGLHRLSATPFRSNVASQRVLEKAGFQREGVLRGLYRKEESYVDAVLYARLVSDGRRA